MGPLGITTSFSCRPSCGIWIWNNFHVIQKFGQLLNSNLTTHKFIPLSSRADISRGAMNNNILKPNFFYASVFANAYAKLGSSSEFGQPGRQKGICTKRCHVLLTEVIQTCAQDNVLHNFWYSFLQTDRPERKEENLGLCQIIKVMEADITAYQAHFGLCKSRVIWATIFGHTMQVSVRA